MTVEHRVVVGLGDIRFVVLECKKCGARLTLKPEGIKDTHLERCNACREPWLSREYDADTFLRSKLALFLLFLAHARETQKDGGDTAVPVRVYFEIDDPVTLAATRRD